jgi:hypothetical protein
VNRWARSLTYSGRERSIGIYTESFDPAGEMFLLSEVFDLTVEQARARGEKLDPFGRESGQRVCA